MVNMRRAQNENRLNNYLLSWRTAVKNVFGEVKTIVKTIIRTYLIRYEKHY